MADDVCQEAFLAALIHIEQCRNPDRFRAWLLRIVRNRALNLKTSESAKAAISMDVAGQLSSAETPHSDLERKELSCELGRAVKALSGLRKRVFELHDIEGWSHTEISEQLGISRGASRVHLHMARKRLRARLAEREEGKG
jgi:RNA polymerase sigma-70 factor (ECF subfamily)